MDLIVGKLIKVAIVIFTMTGIYAFIITSLKNKGIQGKKLKLYKELIHIACTLIMGLAALTIFFA